MLNVPYLERLAAAGVRPEEIDLVMCTHLHHDHVGWNTQQRDGKWVPTFPNARYVFSKPDVDYFSKVDADPKEGPAELGTFRECVVPILEHGKADLISGRPHRLNDFIEIDSAPGHSPGHVFFKLESKGKRRFHRRCVASLAAGLFILTGISQRTRMPHARASAVARSSTTALQATRWCSPVMSASRLRAISKRRKRDTCRTFRCDCLESVQLGGIVNERLVARGLIWNPIE